MQPMRLSSLILIFTIAFGVSNGSMAANIIINNQDIGSGVGLDDPTPVAPVGGNPGTTLGQQRLFVLEAAAEIWGSRLDSAVDIIVDATFIPLDCSAYEAVLGAAGATFVHANFTNAPTLYTWYVQSLANSLSGTNLSLNESDIAAFFNSNIDNNDNCLQDTNWYLGIDSSPGKDIDFLTFALHEMAHGLGFASFVDENTGELLSNYNDRWNGFLLDATTGQLWVDMNDDARAQSATNSHNLTWYGLNVTDETAGLTGGVNANGYIQMYAPDPVEIGLSVSHFDTEVIPSTLMEPFLTEATTDVDLAIALFQDMGWPIISPIETVIVSPKNIRLSSTQSKQLRLETVHEDGTRTDVTTSKLTTWSTNSNQITVTNKGVVSSATSNAIGKTFTVTATYHLGQFSDSTQVEICWRC